MRVPPWRGLPLMRTRAWPWTTSHPSRFGWTVAVGGTAMGRSAATSSIVMGRATPNFTMPCSRPDLAGGRTLEGAALAGIQETPAESEAEAAVAQDILPVMVAPLLAVRAVAHHA